jgi:hypothetical protein
VQSLPRLRGEGRTTAEEVSPVGRPLHQQFHPCAVGTVTQREALVLVLLLQRPCVSLAVAADRLLVVLRRIADLSRKSHPLREDLCHSNGARVVPQDVLCASQPRGDPALTLAKR